MKNELSNEKQINNCFQQNRTWAISLIQFNQRYLFISLSELTGLGFSLITQRSLVTYLTQTL